MIEALPLFHRIAGQPVIVLGEGEAAEAKRRLVARAGGVVVGEADAAARLAFVALDAPEGAAAHLRARWPDAGERRRALDTALGEGGALDPLRAESADRLDGWLKGPGGDTSGGVVEIALRSDDPDDLTLREARLLGSADVLAHEPDVPSPVLDRARADAQRIVLEAGEVPPLRSGLVVILRRGSY